MRVINSAAIMSTVLLALPGLARSSSGFKVAPAHATEPPRVVCAAKLPVVPSGLYCASPVISKGAYDGRGVVRLAPRGRAAIVRAGNDLLLAIDGNADNSARPLLASGKAWRASGYECNNRGNAITCRRGRHGFTIARRLRTF